MKTKIGLPFANTRMAKYLDRRILELKPRKTQRQIAAEAGFRSVNMLSMLKRGANRVPLDRVASLAKALECDPAWFYRMAVEQSDQDTLSLEIERIFGTPVTRNEAEWLKAIREASGDIDPSLTAKALKAIRAIFGK